MTAPVFNPPLAPSPGTQHKRALKLLEAGFGDGYSQPTPDGLNHIRRSVSLTWDALTLAQKDAIDDFFVGKGGTQSFLYQPHGDAVPVLWTCKEWSVTAPAGRWQISATLVQAFGTP
ncbi:phage tail protein [Devosia sp. SL43]|uniref:phage tail protein n=1 Tax=Devosia sp. SL43 TaxID=2806348 RepID=UPI001F1E179D|nr:phage tail protein [Devosia sp. SL43]UJW85768.1 phage tail protein [Devosia sp. SL43]